VVREKLKIIFMGTPGFAVPSLEALVDGGFNVAAVITAPDRPAGRGLKVKHSAVKSFAIDRGIQVLQPANLKDPSFIENLRSINANLQVVVAFRMLPEAVWQMPEYGTFNLHASLLPRYRGAAPINHAIMNGETETGVTTFFLQKDIDTGNIIFRESTPIGPDETFGELHDRLKEIGARLVLKTTLAIQDGTVHEIPQDQFDEDPGRMKKAPKIFRDDCRIDWNSDVDTIYNKIRGLSPYPAAFTTLKNNAGKELNLKIFKVRKQPEQDDKAIPSLYTDNKDFLSVNLSGGSLQITELQMEGKKRMKTQEFLRGFDIQSGWKLI
jgi:methionyl-tRNA formyltransferase